jgi:type II secretory pathway pseudopilin PulG
MVNSKMMLNLFSYLKGFTPFGDSYLTGFTLLEILLAIGIISFLLVAIIPLGLDFYKNQELDTQTQFLIQTLRRAQLKAMSSELDSPFGIRINNQNYVLFKGNSYLTRDTPYDEIFDLPQIIKSSGLSEVVFSKFEGKSNATGNIILSIDNKSRIININYFGTVSLIP